MSDVKCLKKHLISGVFKGYKLVTLTRNGLKFHFKLWVSTLSLIRTSHSLNSFSHWKE